MIKIFIGTSANNEDAESEMVLEYTLRKNSSTPLDITWMRQTHDESSPWGGWNTRQWSTPFSGFRWAIPEVCNYEGKAIYMDVDQVNLRDITELYETNMEGYSLAARRGSRFGGHEFCVIVFDCERISSLLTPIVRMKMNEYSHHRYINMFSGTDHVFDLDPRWNCHDGDGLDIDNIWHLHYTKMSTQPWKPAWFKGVAEEHPRKDLVELWFSMREEAIREGYVPQIRNTVFGEYNIIGQ